MESAPGPLGRRADLTRTVCGSVEREDTRTLVSTFSLLPASSPSLCYADNWLSRPYGANSTITLRWGQNWLLVQLRRPVTSSKCVFVHTPKPEDLGITSGSFILSEASFWTIRCLWLSANRSWHGSITGTVSVCWKCSCKTLPRAEFDERVRTCCHRLLACYDMMERKRRRRRRRRGWSLWAGQMMRGQDGRGGEDDK